jgi:phage terminase Nu1 subunit (DNA packaging protein)
MVNEEIYILTKHAKFQADYIERLPIYRRRHFLHLLQKENDEIKRLQNQAQNKNNFRPRR